MEGRQPLKRLREVLFWSSTIFWVFFCARWGWAIAGDLSFYAMKALWYFIPIDRWI